MNTSYDRIAGQSVARLAALSDGIFAVAMTLLALDLRVPVGEGINSERDLWHSLIALAPQVVMYMMSSVTLGIFWVGQQTQLNCQHLIAGRGGVGTTTLTVRFRQRSLWEAWLSLRGGRSPKPQFPADPAPSGCKQACRKSCRKGSEKPG